jgi:hypothetical protein
VPDYVPSRYDPVCDQCERVGSRDIVHSLCYYEQSDVGGAVAMLLAPESGWINGQRIEVSGGMGQYLVEVLAKELGHCGVTVNSILPTGAILRSVPRWLCQCHVRRP